MDGDSPFDYRGIDDVIHSRIRLSVMAILASVEDATFTYLRDKVGGTDGNLSTHLGRLRDAKYVESTKEIDDGRPVTRYRLSAVGRDAFARYLDTLDHLLGGIDP